MSRILLMLCTLIVAVAGVMAQTPGADQAARKTNPPDARWYRYTLKGEDFSVALPHLPSVKISSEMRQRRVIKASSKGVAYTVQVVENPKRQLSLDAFIEEQTTANPAEKLTYERDLTRDGIAGKAFVYPDGKGVVQFYATPERLYEFRAAGAAIDDPRVATFFSSLTLKKEKGSIELSDAVQSFDLDPSEHIYMGKELESKARLLSKPDPIFSDKAKSKGTTGTVVLRCVFAADGTVTNIRVIAGLPNGLTEKSIEAARKIKFVPAMKDGKPVSMWMQLEYNFNIFQFVR